MTKERTTLSFDMRPGESLAIGGTVVHFVHKSGQRARLRVTAPRATPIKKVAQHEREIERESVPSMATCAPG